MARWAPLWQLEQSPAVPVWFITAGRKAAKLVWQLSQAPVVGMWLVGLGRPVPPFLWQLAQLWSPILTGGVKRAWSTVAVAQVVVDAWQVSQEAVVTTWLDDFAWAFWLRKEPLWQVAHWPARPLWFMVRATKLAVLVWQVSHCLLSGMWPAPLPTAVVPLWQEEQRPAVVASWMKLAGFQETVPWQLSQEAVVTTWLAGLPVERTPWQVAQVPGTTLLWS
jgi:hypothetical protein